MLHGTLSTQQHSEEDLKYSKDNVKVAMELCIKNMIYLWKRVSIRLS
jgi:hypothetical protein